MMEDFVALHPNQQTSSNINEQKEKKSTDEGIEPSTLRMILLDRESWLDVSNLIRNSRTMNFNQFGIESATSAPTGRQ
jgi:hypothetical protein